MSREMDRLSRIIKISASIIGFFAIFIYIYAIFAPQGRGEADNGLNAKVATLDNWTLITEDGSEKSITLPYSSDVELGKTVRIKSVLPDNIPNGRAVCIRGSVQDITIYINGKNRTEYNVDNLRVFTNNPPSAFVFVPLSEKDDGAEIEIDITSHSATYRGMINPVYYASPRAIWFNIASEHSFATAVAIALILLGVITVFACLAFKKSILELKELIYLGQAMIIIGMWIITESRMRQLIFRNPSFTALFAFILAGIMAFPVVMFFNEVQDKRYRKLYMTICGFMVIQNVVNLILFLLKIKDMRSTMILGHFWTLLAVAAFIFTIIKDLTTGDIKKYSLTALGVSGLMACTVVEIANVYMGNNLGPLISLGMTVLLVMTLAQKVKDAYQVLDRRRRQQTEMTLATIRMVAGAIDAKDEYTGGHSNRVAEYASILAKNLGYSEDDVERVRYIGLMHDVGKIGVPDVILNKSGKLSDDEFMLMKLHTTIGADMLKDIDTVPGLQEGVKYHHERYDGHGYPAGLKGDDIPEVARILCLADAYDAMTSNRVYRRRLSDEQVRDEIERCSGTQFDPLMVPVFLSLIDSGDISPISKDGFEYSVEGSRSKAAILQKMLVSPQEYSGAYEVTNPEFMRMLVYIVKLAERNRQKIKIMLFKVEQKAYTASPGEGLMDAGSTIESLRSVDMMLEKAVTGSLRSTDVTTPYAPMQRLVVFVDLEDDNLISVINRIIVSFRALDKTEMFNLKYEEVDLKNKTF